MNGFKLSFSYPHAYANKHLRASILNACLCLCVIYLIYLKRSLIQITCGFFFIYKYNMGWFLEALNILQYFNYRDMCGWVLRIICVHVSLHSALVISDPLPNKYRLQPKFYLSVNPIWSAVSPQRMSREAFDCIGSIFCWTNSHMWTYE